MTRFARLMVLLVVVAGCSGGLERGRIDTITPLDEPERTYQIQYVTRRDRERARTLEGVALVGGQVIVPPQYDDVVPYGGRLLVAERGAPNPGFDLYTVPTGAKRETPYVDVWSASLSPVFGRFSDGRHPQVPYGYLPSPSGTGWRVELFDEHGRVTSTLDEVGTMVTGLNRHPAVVGYSRVLIVTYDRPDGVVVSRLHRTDGMPISPFLPGLERSQFSETTASTGARVYGQHGPASPSDQVYSGQHEEWALPIGRLDLPHLPDQRLLQPIDRDGGIMQLPVGVIGMLPLAFRHASIGYPETGTVHGGWGLVYEGTAGGYVFALGIGTADEVIAAAPHLSRFDGLREIQKGKAPMIVARRLGETQWRLLRTPTLGEIATYHSPESAIAALEDAERQFQERMRAEEAERGRRREAEEAAFVANAPGQLKALVAASNSYEAWILARRIGAAGWGYCLEHLEPRTWHDVWHGRSLQVDPAILARATAVMQAREDRQAASELETLRQRADAAARSRIVAVDLSGSDAVLQQQRQVFHQNLDAYNRGAQNWHPGKAP